MSGLVKGTYSKDHGTAKAGDERKFNKSTLEALQAHGILDSPKKTKENETKK